MHKTSQQIISMLNNISVQHSTKEVFEDFCTMAAASYHNALYTLGKVECPARYKPLADKLENEFDKIKQKYSEDAYQELCTILAELYKGYKSGICDYLGEIYMGLNIGNGNRGQYFTPFHIAEMMALISSPKEQVIKQIQDAGYIGMSDETCGSGVMALAFIKIIKDDYNISQYIPNLHIHLTDIDNFCVKMAYIQMSMLQVKARIVWGNTITNEKYEIFDTPALQTEYIGKPAVMDTTKEVKQMTLF